MPRDPSRNDRTPRKSSRAEKSSRRPVGTRPGPRVASRRRPVGTRRGLRGRVVPVGGRVVPVGRSRVVPVGGRVVRSAGRASRPGRSRRESPVRRCDAAAGRERRAEPRARSRPVAIGPIANEAGEAFRRPAVVTRSASSAQRAGPTKAVRRRSREPICGSARARDPRRCDDPCSWIATCAPTCAACRSRTPRSSAPTWPRPASSSTTTRVGRSITRGLPAPEPPGSVRCGRRSASRPTARSNGPRRSASCARHDGSPAIRAISP